MNGREWRGLAFSWACVVALPVLANDASRLPGIASTLERADDSLDWHYFWEDLDELESRTELFRAEWFYRETVRRSDDPACMHNVDASVMKGRAATRLHELDRRKRQLYRPDR